MDDFFDTRFEGKTVEIDENQVKLGDDVNLTQKDPTLRKILVGAGWDVNFFGTDILDLDLSLFLLDKNDNTSTDEDFIFYNQPKCLNGGIEHQGDSRTGAGDGDDESILLDVHALPFTVLKIMIVISIYKGYERKQNFGMARNAYVRIINAEQQHELFRYNLTDIFEDKTETAIIVGALNREGPQWHFVPMAEFVEGGLGALARRYGLIINQE